MKKILLITLLLIVGCSKPEPINYETILVNRKGVFYTNDTNKPYSGLVFSLYDDGKKKEEGKATIWHENGQKSDEVTYKDGELISEKCWDEDGNECECRAFSSGCY